MIKVKDLAGDSAEAEQLEQPRVVYVPGKGTIGAEPGEWLLYKNASLIGHFTDVDFNNLFYIEGAE